MRSNAAKALGKIQWEVQGCFESLLPIVVTPIMNLNMVIFKNLYCSPLVDDTGRHHGKVWTPPTSLGRPVGRA